MSVDNKVPEIRFEGFRENWNQRKLDTIFGKIRNAFVGTATPYYVKEGHFYLESNNVKDGKINRKNEIFINDEFYYKQSDKWLREGNIVMVQSGHVGHTAVIPPELNNIAAHALIMFTHPKEEMSSHFLNFQFQTDKVKTKLSEITTGNTIKHILSSEMKEFEMFFSDYEEQTQIGNYFQKLDALINQHQQKHDKLSSIKKAMLEKMFPKQGDSMPEIRFKGFSGKWEERKFSDIATRVSTHHQSTCLPCVEYEDIVAGKGRLNKDIYQKKTFKAGLKFEADDVLFGKLRPYLKNWFLADFEGLAVGDFWVLRADNVASTFLFSLIQTNEFELISNLSAGSKMPRSDWGLVSSSCFFVPKNISESNAIGNYFQKLDSLINLHQQQITKLNNIKQACLSKMFV